MLIPARKGKITFYRLPFRKFFRFILLIIKNINGIYTKTYTVESVTSRTSDKVCDQISDAILDECLKQDPLTRAGVETFGNHGLLVIGGEVTTKADFNAEEIARKVYKDIGYNQDLNVIVGIVKQSPDIAQGVNTGGAGDQGMMYGFATDETPEFMPYGGCKSSCVGKMLGKCKKKWIRLDEADGKTQITVIDGKIKTILISTQHDENVSQEEIKKSSYRKSYKTGYWRYFWNRNIGKSNRQICSGGFEADTGLTGRKIMVDTYCGLITHGGGCFSGKDPSKVDRSAAYMCKICCKKFGCQWICKTMFGFCGLCNRKSRAING